MSTPAYWNSRDYSETFIDITEFSAWDVVFINAQPLPGICTVRANVSRKLDILSSAGSVSPRINDIGTEPAKIEIDIKIWTQPQLDEWGQLSVFLTPSRNLKVEKQAQVFTIIHPALDLQGIHQIAIESVSSLEQVEPGIYEAHISGIEWFPKRIESKVSPTKTGGKSNGTTGNLANVPTITSPSKSGTAGAP